MKYGQSLAWFESMIRCQFNWGISSIRRAPHLQCGGSRGRTDMLHQVYGGLARVVRASSSNGCLQQLLCLVQLQSPPPTNGIATANGAEHRRTVSRAVRSRCIPPTMQARNVTVASQSPKLFVGVQIPPGLPIFSGGIVFNGLAQRAPTSLVRVQILVPLPIYD